MAKPKLKLATRLFLGVTLAQRNNWEQFFAPCVATRSSKPDSMEKEVTEKRKARSDTAHFLPVAGTVTSCVLLDQDGKELFSAMPGFDTKQGDVSARALAVIATYLEQEDLLVQNPTLYDVQVRLFGLKIRDRLRIMALDAIRYGLESGEGVDSPVGLWYHRPFEPAPWTDPYEALVPSELRRDVAYDGLCRFLGVDLDPNVDVDTDARLQAELARQIAIRGKLFPTE